ncbi:MAG: class GN sortase [Erythrobacter sp.]|nr:class GN sortase [Erythrobacter sp.]
MSPRSHRRLARCASLLLVLAGGALAAQAAWIPAKAALAQVLLDRAFDQSLATGQPVRPWPWADTAPLSRITVGRLGESAIVLSGASGQALAFGPTELAAPRGVTLLAAHRDTHFAFMADLRAGDILTLQRLDGGTARYAVRQFQTVRWDRFAISRNLPGEWLVLATCYPFDGATRGPLRQVAWAERVE